MSQIFFTGTNCIVAFFYFVQRKRNTKHIALSLSFHWHTTRRTHACTHRSKRLIVEITYFLTICRHSIHVCLCVCFHYYYFFCVGSRTRTINQFQSILTEFFFCCVFIPHESLDCLLLIHKQLKKTANQLEFSCNIFVLCFKLNHFISINLKGNWLT